MNQKKTTGSFLEGIGIDTSEAGQPFFKPSGRLTTLTLTAIRPPSKKEAVKEFAQKDGTMGRINVLAIATVEVQGVEHVWEISSRRALGALNDVVTGVPMDLDVQTKGSGTSTLYLVKEHRKMEGTKFTSKGSEAPKAVKA